MLNDEKYARGGIIQGPRDQHGDSIPAMLSPGVHWLTPSVADLLARADELADRFENGFEPTHVRELVDGEWQDNELAREGDDEIARDS